MQLLHRQCCNALAETEEEEEEKEGDWCNLCMYYGSAIQPHRGFRSHSPRSQENKAKVQAHFKNAHSIT